MTRECIYDKLRDIGVSVETADSMSEVMEEMEEVKQQAIILWSKGYSMGEAASIIPMTRQGFFKVIKKLREKIVRSDI